ncbi:SDR family oxidoreductase [Anaerococcus porci]|uniref:SDR family oxidoreductase n=1 Tax=Anaerococcus porci TaxID=2652269 RepID=A0A6N7VTD4_9FIRM|nr:SDR family oxidoreductase [Anaerococcus porci]MDY3006655.1 SDR family oxidoreductase [Anaerococcus porci]MSS78122.1 SDR family oxidoreductase [Anaerococcus porci]
MSWLGLENKIVIVTGAASGIGKAVTEGLIEAGAKVVACDINSEKPEFKGESENNLLYQICDVTKREDVKSSVKAAVDEFGTLDVIVNNAGINIPRLLVDPKKEDSEYELDDKVFDKVVNINLKGLFYCAQEAARVFVKENSGVIINMSSESGLEGSEGQSIYAASKNAVNSFTRSWSKELGKYGIRVVGVAPGILEATGLRTISYETALAYTRGITVEDLRKGYSSTKTTPLGRSGKLSEVANLVSFLASDRASYIHGVTINVAGGKTRG